MALINCPNCGHRISDKAQRCPKCAAHMLPEISDKAQQSPKCAAHMLPEIPDKAQQSPKRAPHMLSNNHQAIEPNEKNIGGMYFLPFILGILMIAYIIFSAIK